MSVDKSFICLVTAPERCQYSAAGPRSPCACDPNRNLLGSPPPSAGCLTARHAQRERSSQSTQRDLKNKFKHAHISPPDFTSFFFLSSSFRFFSSLIWARRCFFRSSSAFRSLLSDMVSCSVFFCLPHETKQNKRCVSGIASLKAQRITACVRKTQNTKLRCTKEGPH